MRVDVPRALVEHEKEEERELGSNVTPVCNWVVGRRQGRGGVIAGAHPFGSKDLIALLDAGVVTFICLMQERELQRHSVHYIEKARKLSERKLDYIHMPVEDCKVPREEDAWKQVEAVMAAMEKGDVYVHCRGGHGRTGLVVCLLLATLHHCSAFEALDLCSRLHATRESRSHIPSPQTAEQRSMVHRLVGSLAHAREEAAE